VCQKNKTILATRWLIYIQNGKPSKLYSEIHKLILKCVYGNARTWNQEDKLEKEQT
jgi:hypothetical protein